jgi:hypothetical protein
MTTIPAHPTSESVYANTARRSDSAYGIPLNLQRQWVVLFGVAIAVIALVAGLYLDVTARAAITGREIQNLELDIAANRRNNADYATNYARLMSNQVMQDRAQQSGFTMLEYVEVEYMVVPGYLPSDGVFFTSDVVEQQPISSLPEFHESLLDWFARALQTASSPLGGLR